MKNNNFKAFALTLIIGLAAMPAFALASKPPETAGANVGGADTATSVSAPATAGGNTGGADTTTSSSIPATAGGNVGGADTTTSSSIPATAGGNVGGADTTTSSSFPATAGGNTGGAETPAPVPPPSTTGGSTNTPVGGHTSGGSGTVSSGRSIISYPGGSVMPALVGVNSCGYIGSYMSFGANNSKDEVTKLQTFLKNSEGLNVDINGVYDTKTVLAVKAFQLKYVDEIMKPWGVSYPTGNVFATTKKKINELSCGQSLSLSQSESAYISNYKSGASNTEISNANTKSATSSTNSSSEEIGQASSSDQTAVASKPGFWARLWNAIKSIFRN